MSGQTEAQREAGLLATEEIGGGRLARVIGDESGMTTAEYAVGTVAACGMGGIMLKLLTSPEVTNLLWKVIEKAFSFIF